MDNKARHCLCTLSLFLIHAFILVSGEKWKPGDPCPTEIRSEIPGRSEDMFGHMEIVHAAMITCPNITTLELYSSWPSPCIPPRDFLVFPFSKSAAETERWASAPEILILDDFVSDTIQRFDYSLVGASWGVFNIGEHAPWFVDWYNEYTSNRTSTKHDTRQPESQQKRLQESPETDPGDIKADDIHLGSMATDQVIMEIGSNSSAADNGFPEIPGPPAVEKETNFDIWLKVMDFSRIHTLKLGQRAKWFGTYTLTPRLAKTLPPHLTSLKGLELKNAIGARFIRNLPKNVSLTHLTWREPWSGGQNIPAFVETSIMPIFQRHGSNLKVLYHHSSETGKVRSPTLTTAQLNALTSLAPNIEKLTIDLARPFPEDWPWEDLKLLAGNLPNLTDLTIYFDLYHMPCSCWPHYAHQVLPTPGSPAVLPRIQTPPPGWKPPPPRPEYPRLPASMPYATSPAPSPCSVPAEERRGCLGRDAYNWPMVNISQGEKIAAFLLEQRAGAGGKPFQRIRIRSGNDGWGVDGEYLFGPTVQGKPLWEWIDGKSSWVSCFGKDWGELPEEEKKEIVVEEKEFLCFGGENLEELKEWEGRCLRGTRHQDGAWRTMDGHGHGDRDRDIPSDEHVGEARKKWLLESENRE